MLKQSAVLNWLVIGLLASTSAHAFNSTAFNNCSTALINCAVGLLAINPNSTNFQNCTTPFSRCLDNLVFDSLPPQPIECFSADAAWENFYISIGSFLGIVIVNTIVVPMLLKGASWTISECMNLDAQRHPILRRIGRFIGIFTDDNRDGRVTANEIINPQGLIAVAGLSIPFYYWFIANDKQALCDYARATFRYIHPEFFIDEDDE